MPIMHYKNYDKGISPQLTLNYCTCGRDDESMACRAPETSVMNKIETPRQVHF